MAPFALAAMTAQAQSADDPWYLGASVGWTQVSNLYRVSEAPSLNGTLLPNDDQVQSLSLLAGVRARLGRQRWQLDTRVTQNQYKRNQDLRNLSYSGNATWDWASGSRLSGQVLFGSQRSLAPFNPGLAVFSTRKNIQRYDRARAGVRYGLYGLWSADASVSASRTDYSLSDYDRFDNSQRSADLGLNWQPSPSLSLRSAVRKSKGQYPRFRTDAAGFVVNRFDVDAIDLSANWTPSARHQLGLRVSDSRTRYSETRTSESSGRSGQFNWTWLPTSKLSLQAQLRRENGAENGAFDLGRLGSILTSDSRRYDSFELQGAYAISAKVVLDASVSELRRDFTNAFGLSTGGGKDRTRSASLGARWNFDRNGQFSCQYARDRRTGTANNVSPPYSASSVGCTVQYMLH